LPAIAASISTSVDAGTSQQRASSHQLTALTVAALHDIDVRPGGAQHLGFASCQTFDVVIALPIAADTGVIQLRAAAPSRCMVQAPHWLMPQPNLVPVSFSSPRSTHSKRSVGFGLDVDDLAVDIE